MANFKVGDRVRIVGPAEHPARQRFVGLETVIIALPNGNGYYTVAMIDERWGKPGLLRQHQMTPLTPPAEEADTWAADKVKQVTKPQHLEPVRENTLLPIWP